MYIHIVVCVYIGSMHTGTLSSYVATPQLTPSNWMQLFNCTTWYPSRVIHDNQLVDEQLLVQMNPDVCRKEIGVTLLTHSGIQCSLANGYSLHVFL